MFNEILTKQFVFLAFAYALAIWGFADERFFEPCMVSALFFVVLSTLLPRIIHKL